MKKLLSVFLTVIMALSSVCLCACDTCDNGSYDVATDVQRDGGCISGDKIESGVKLVMRKLEASEYDAYSVSESAESAYMLIATVKPEDALDKRLNWSISWTNDGNEWSSDKSVTDYMTVEGSDDGAVVSCLQAFGAQISVTASLLSNETITATCSFDYAARVAGYRIDFGDWTYKIMDFEDDDAVDCPVFLDVGSALGSSGGVLNVIPFLSSVYTLENNFTVKAMFHPTVEYFVSYEDYTIALYDGFADFFGTDVIGKTVSFGWDQLKMWYFNPPGNEIRAYLSDYEPEFVYEFLADMRGQTLFTLKLQFEGKYSSFECEVPIICGGVENSAT